MRMSRVEFLFSGACEKHALQAARNWFGDDFALDAVAGSWKGKPELAWRIVAYRPTDTEAYAFRDGEQVGVMPAIVNSVETWARNVAENLALEFKQEAVAFAIAPVHFELTTGQARYRRNGQ